VVLPKTHSKTNPKKKEHKRGRSRDWENQRAGGVAKGKRKEGGEITGVRESDQGKRGRERKKIVCLRKSVTRGHSSRGGRNETKKNPKMGSQPKRREVPRPVSGGGERTALVTKKRLKGKKKKAREGKPAGKRN